jgi:signal recognition particle receptor subunit beta
MIDIMSLILWQTKRTGLLANKQDLTNAATKEEISEDLDLHNILCNHTWHLQPCSVKSGQGLNEGNKL